jgi:hypothetical protein
MQDKEDEIPSPYEEAEDEIDQELRTQLEEEMQRESKSDLPPKSHNSRTKSNGSFRKNKKVTFNFENESSNGMEFKLNNEKQEKPKNSTPKVINYKFKSLFLDKTR